MTQTYVLILVIDGILILMFVLLNHQQNQMEKATNEFLSVHGWQMFLGFSVNASGSMIIIIRLGYANGFGGEFQ